MEEITQDKINNQVVEVNKSNKNTGPIIISLILFLIVILLNIWGF